VFIRVSAAVDGFKPRFERLRERGGGWQRGQKWLLLPATITRLIFDLQRKHAFPSRW